VIAVQEAGTPLPEHVRSWVKRNGLAGEYAVLAGRVPPGDPAGYHRMEVVDL
jgi:hypothetical protein